MAAATSVGVLTAFEEKILLPMFKSIVMKQLHLDNIFQFLPNYLLFSITQYPPEVIEIFSKLFIKFIGDINLIVGNANGDTAKFNLFVVFLLFHHSAYVQAYIWLNNHIENDKETMDKFKHLLSTHKQVSNNISGLSSNRNLFKNLKEQVITTVLIKRYGQYKFVLEKLRKLLLRIHVDKLEANYSRDKRRGLHDVFTLLSNELDCINLQAALAQQLNDLLDVERKKSPEHPSKTSLDQQTAPSSNSSPILGQQTTPSSNSSPILGPPSFLPLSSYYLNLSSNNPAYNNLHHHSHQLLQQPPPPSLTSGLLTDAARPVYLLPKNYLLPMRLWHIAVPVLSNVSLYPCMPLVTWLPALCAFVQFPGATVVTPTTHSEFRLIQPNDFIILIFRAFAKFLCLPPSSFHRFGTCIEFVQWEAATDPQHHCPICFAAFVASDVVANLPCRHPLHFYCLKKWKTTCLEREVAWTCPLCRKGLDV